MGLEAQLSPIEKLALAAMEFCREPESFEAFEAMRDSQSAAAPVEFIMLHEAANEYAAWLATQTGHEPSVELMFYIQNVGFCGNSLKWWRPEGKGYTLNIDDAWKVNEAKARSICQDRPKEDIMRPAEIVDAIRETSHPAR